MEYPGYGGGRGLALDCLLYAAAGYAHFFMDVRGQGSGWRAGDTPDREPDPNPHHPGFMTRGGLDPRTYYYRRVITDAVRAVASEGPALFSAALMDTLCPASTVYGAYHHYTGPKRIEVYPYNGHEGGESLHKALSLRFLAEIFGSPRSRAGVQAVHPRPPRSRARGP